MNILHVTNNFPSKKFPIYGIFVKEQIDSLSEKGVNNQVIYINGRGGGKLEYFKSYFKILLKLLTNNFDCIHCHHSFSGILFILTFGFLFNKSVLSFQNPPSKEVSFIPFNFIAFFFDLIIIKNKVEKINHSKIRVIPNGVNVDFFCDLPINFAKKKLKLSTKKKYILFMDSNSRRTQKRLDRYNDVINNLKLDFPEIEPLILKNTERELIPLFINSSSLHLITSDFEGSPNSVKECMACNVPVVSTPVGDIFDNFGDLQNCLVAKDFDVKSLTKLCKKILSQKILNNSRDKIFKLKFTSSLVADQLIKIYTS